MTHGLRGAGRREQTMNAAINRKPSMSITPFKPSGILPPIGGRKATFRDVFAAAKAEYPSIHGMTCVDAKRAYFQSEGDATYYSVAISRYEYAALSGFEGES